MSPEAAKAYEDYRTYRQRLTKNLGRPAVLPIVELVEQGAKIYEFPKRPNPNPEGVVA